MNQLKKYLFVLIFCVVTIGVHAQKGKDSLLAKPYNPMADAEKEYIKTLHLADSLNKHVLIQVGGNWCVWCLRLHEFCNKNSKIDSVLKSDYIFTLINYSKENYNKELLSQFGNIKRFGFPVWIIVDEKGNLLHIQDTGLLEEGKGYSDKKILSVLRNWNKQAVIKKFGE